MKRIVLAYSGGLTTSAAVAWLAETYGAEIVAVTLDLGQGRDLDDVRERALAIGAARAHVLDVREEFARDFVLPAVQAGAVYEGRYPLATALARPLIARHLVGIARLEGATTIAHGGTGRGNDPVRLDVSVRALEPDMTVLAPAETWGFTRDEVMGFARARGIPVPPAFSGPFRIDTNLWGRSIESDELEDLWREPPEEIYAWTKPPAVAPDEPALVEIGFEEGVPVSINDVSMPLVDLIDSLQTIAGTHGVGRLDMVENRLVDVKSREIYEAPAAVVLHMAHAELQQLVTPRDLERLTSSLAVTYADLVYSGAWFTATREAIAALVARVQQKVTGTIRVRLFKGDCKVVGRRAAFALHEQPRQAEATEVRT